MNPMHRRARSPSFRAPWRRRCGPARENLSAPRASDSRGTGPLPSPGSRPSRAAGADLAPPLHLLMGDETPRPIRTGTSHFDPWHLIVITSSFLRPAPPFTGRRWFFGGCFFRFFQADRNRPPRGCTPAVSSRDFAAFVHPSRSRGGHFGGPPGIGGGAREIFRREQTPVKQGLGPAAPSEKELFRLRPERLAFALLLYMDESGLRKRRGPRHSAERSHPV